MVEVSCEEEYLDKRFLFLFAFLWLSYLGFIKGAALCFRVGPVSRKLLIGLVWAQGLLELYLFFSLYSKYIWGFGVLYGYFSLLVIISFSSYIETCCCYCFFSRSS